MHTDISDSDCSKAKTLCNLYNTILNRLIDTISPRLSVVVLVQWECMIVIVYKAVFLKLFQTKDHLANKKKFADHLTKYPRNNRPSTQTWHQTIVSGTCFSRVGTPFLRTGRLVIDMTMRYSKHRES